MQADTTFDAGRIRAGMRVIGSDGAMVGVVRRIAPDRITVASAIGGGRARDIPFARVSRIDRCVHLNAMAQGPHSRRASVWIAGLACMLASMLAWQGLAPDDPAATPPPQSRAAHPATRKPPAAAMPDRTAERMRDFLASDGGTPQRFPLDRLRFATGSAVVTAADEAALAKLAEALKAYPGAHAKIVAYPATDGPTDLARRRAVAVLSMLGAHGVAPGHLEVGPGTRGGRGRPIELVIVEK